VRQLVILLDESRSPYHPMRVSKVRSLRSRELNGNGAVLDFVGRAAFSTQGAKVMSSRPNIEALHVEKKSVGGCLSNCSWRTNASFLRVKLDVLSRLGNGVKVRSLRALVQTNRSRLWAKVGQNNQAMRMAKSEIFTHDASHEPRSHSQPDENVQSEVFTFSSGDREGRRP
jgi:hypothetical protein